MARRSDKDGTGARRPARATLAARVAALEAALAALTARVERMEGGEVRVLRAGRFDGRARARPSVGPKCPGCRLVVDGPAERCPWCGLSFAALPPRLRPVPLPPSKPARARKAKPSSTGSGARAAPAAGKPGRRRGTPPR